MDELNSSNLKVTEQDRINPSDESEQVALPIIVWA